jgi:hypothetical protein
MTRETLQKWNAAIGNVPRRRRIGAARDRHHGRTRMPIEVFFRDFHRVKRPADGREEIKGMRQVVRFGDVRFFPMCRRARSRWHEWHRQRATAGAQFVIQPGDYGTSM